VSAENRCVCYYSFSQINGSNIFDESGSSNSALLVGGRIAGDGLLNEACEFDGVNDFLDCGNNPIMNPTNAITISAWVNYDSMKYGQSPPLMERRTADNLSGYVLSDLCQDRPMFDVYLNGIGWRYAQGIPGSVVTGRWYHMVGTYNGQGVKVYLDGQRVGSNLCTGVLSLTTGHNRVGLNGVDNFFLDGKVDEIRVYNYALSDAEVLALYSDRDINFRKLLVEGTPEQAGAPTPQGYGSNFVRLGTTVTNTVQEIVEVAGVARYTCVGWEGTGDVPTSGTTTRVVFEVTTNSTLRWIWRCENWVDLVAMGPGRINAESGWYTNGSILHITATASNNAHFAFWSGSVPQNFVRDENPLIMPVSRGSRIKAVFSGNVVPELVDSLVMQYDFDPTNATTVFDRSGFENHGTLTGGARLDVDGVVGHGLNCDGVNGYVECGNSALLNPTNCITVSCWVKYDSTKLGQSPALVERRPAANNAGYVLADRCQDRPWFAVYLVGKGWSSAEGLSGTVKTGLWHHMVGTYNGSQVQIYLDGELVGTNPVSGVLSLTTAGNRVGKNAVSAFYLDGTLDDARVYTRSLGAVEVQELYALGTASTVRLTVTGVPGPRGVSKPYGYGTNFVPVGKEFSCSVPSTVVNGANRSVCTGWVGSGDVPLSGTITTVVCTVSNNSSLAWQWRDESYLQVLTLGSGTVSALDNWYSTQTVIGITATPKSGYSFLYWIGDVPSGESTNNPLMLTLSSGKTITAVFTRPGTGNLENGLVLYYSFNHVSSNQVFDESGWGNTGTLVNGAFVASNGVRGITGNFDGINDYINCGAASVLLPTQQISVSAWVNYDTTILGHSPAIIECRPSANNAGYVMCDLNQDRPWFAIYVEGVGWQSVSGIAGSLVTGKWSHLVGTYDGKLVKIYLNGTLAGTNSCTGNIRPTTGSTRIGQNYPSGFYLDGRIDEVRVYNRALLPNEVLDLYVVTTSTLFNVTVDGWPQRYGNSYPLAYGSNLQYDTTVVTNSITSPILSETVRHQCIGWTGSGDVDAHGAGTSVVFTVSTNSTLTWLWRTDYRLTTSAEVGGAVLPGSDWIPAGSNVTVTAIPIPGYSFSHWTGDTTVGDETQRILTVWMTEPRNLKAQFIRNTCTISGQITYHGSQMGQIYVEAFSDDRYDVRTAWTQIANPGYYQINGLPAGGNYWIRAYRDGNANGHADGQEPIGAFVGNPFSTLLCDRTGIDIHLIRLTAPQNLQAVGGAGGILLNWNPNPEPGIAGYNVYRFDLEWGRFERLNSAPIPTPNYIDRSVVRGWTYWYYVTAVMQSDCLSDYLESPASSLATAESGQLVLRMSDYRGTTNGVARLRVNVSDAEGILGNDMAFILAYNPAILTPLSQVSEAATVESTVLTEGLTVSNNAAIATGRLEIVFNRSVPITRHATLRILGSHYESGPNRPIAIMAKYRLNEGDWLKVNADHNINNGKSYAIDLGEFTTGTNCVLAITESEQNRVRQSDRDVTFVKTYHNGEGMTNLPGVFKPSDLAYYLRAYVDDDLVVRIGADEVLYLFELGESSEGPEADFQDVVALVEFNEGSVLKGEGHLFDVLFKVAPGASWGTQDTNRMLEAQIKDQAGILLGCDYSDVAIFQVQSNYFLGDINGDGMVSVNGDFTLAMKLAAGQRNPTDLELIAGDIDGDGAITKLDATLIKRIAQGQPVNPGGSSQTGFAAMGQVMPMSEIDGYELTIGRFEVHTGGKLEVPVIINNGQNVASIELRMNYDNSFLTFLGATNSELTAAFGVEAHAVDGVVTVVLSSDSGLSSGSGTVTVLSFGVADDAEPGEVTELTLAHVGLGTEYGAELGWDSEIETVPGSVTVVLRDDQDGDGDGLSDYAEQFFDGQAGYNPWNALTSPWGTDTDVNRTDTDGDGMNDGDEAAAGTSPLDRHDVLALRDLQPLAAAHWEVSWPTVTGKFYLIEGSTNLLQGFKPLSDSISGDGTIQVWQDTNAPTKGGRFYRIRKME